MKLVFFLEEPSMKEMLKQFLPKIISNSDHHIQYIVFEGKNDLQKRVGLKLRAWHQNAETRFIILHDQDSNNCVQLKQQLRKICHSNGKDVLIRIACTELESWYIGDLKAVAIALSQPHIAKLIPKSKYRNPDTLANAAEELGTITHKIYQKVAGSRAIGAELDADRNTSNSFNIFVAGIRNLVNG